MSILSRQIEQYNTQKPQKTTKHDDPQIPQPDLRFARGNSEANNRKPKTTKTGPEPKKNTHKFDLPRDTVACPLHHSQKHANELKPRHSSKHEGLASLYVYPGIDVPNCTITRGYNLCLSQRPLRSACPRGPPWTESSPYISTVSKKPWWSKSQVPPSRGGGR